MTSSNRLSYITGLDEIRAVAVMAVLFYPANAPWALGGLLITSLLLTEWQFIGRIHLKNFWLLLALLPILAALLARDALPRVKEDVLVV